MEYLNLNLVLLISMMIATMFLHGTEAQTRHIVGGSFGWTIPSSGAAAYTNWASRQTFTVDDLLVFTFTDGEHDVAEISAAAFGSCTATNPISLATNGPATLTLTTPGTHYYICTFRSHCQIGQKLTINVSETASATPPPATPRAPVAVSPPTIKPPPPSVPPKTPVPPPDTTGSPPSPTPATPFAPCPRITPATSDQSSLPPTATELSGGARSFTTLVPSTLLIYGFIFLNY
ncbi:hypothetical protein LXL04_028064 [Taraxacum kok-saghyz]